MSNLNSTKKILFLSANPKNTSKLRLDEEAREIQESLRLSANREQFEFITAWAVRTSDLRRSLLQYSPYIVHFSGHGLEEGIVLEDITGNSCTVNKATLARLLKLCPTIQCVFLNACYSQSQASEIAHHVAYVIGSKKEIQDKKAIRFSAGFYDALGYGRSFEDAYEFGIAAIEGEPVVIHRDLLLEPESEQAEGGSLSIPVLIHGDSDREIKTSTKIISNSKKAYRNRQALINKVRNYWIKGVLEHSFQNQSIINIEFRKRLDLSNIFGADIGVSEELEVPLPAETQLIDVFDELGEGRTLLILGEPGSGKTISLLQLAQTLLNRVEQDPEHLIPVVFNLSSWNGKQSLSNWLLEELNTKYQVPRPVGQSLLQSNELLPLLDGLDEVRPELQEACVITINQFQQSCETEMIICSRLEEYESLGTRLNIQEAICLKPLSDEQISLYLDQLGSNLDDLNSLLRSDGKLQEMARSPLMLNIMILAYQNSSTQERDQIGSARENYEYIFDIYIRQMLKRRGGQKLYPDVATKYWLSWLAQKLTYQSQSIFLLDRIQPNWLNSNLEFFLYRLGVAFAVAVLFGFGFGILGQLSIGLIEVGTEDLFQERLINAILMAVIYGGMAGAITFLLPAKIKLIETLNWSWKRAFSRAIGWLMVGTIIGLAGGLVVQSGWFLLNGYPIKENDESWISWILHSLLIFDGILGGLACFIFGITYGLYGVEIETAIKPNHAIWRSLRSAVYFGIASGTFGALVGGVMFVVFGGKFYLGFINGLCLGLLTGFLGGGGLASIKHYILRLILYFKKYMPWHCSRFLEYAAERLFLQKVGGGYIFAHRLLMEHFATLET